MIEYINNIINTTYNKYIPSYSIMDEGVKSIMNIFGWVVVFIIALAILFILLAIYKFVRNYLQKKREREKIAEMINNIDEGFLD